MQRDLICRQYCVNISREVWAASQVCEYLRQPAVIQNGHVAIGGDGCNTQYWIAILFPFLLHCCECGWRTIWVIWGHAGSWWQSTRIFLKKISSVCKKNTLIWMALFWLRWMVSLHFLFLSQHADWEQWLDSPKSSRSGKIARPLLCSGTLQVHCTLRKRSR